MTAELPWAHGFHLFRDGDAWCAVGPHFIDLMKSYAGFGDTKEDAVRGLHARMRSDRWWDNKVLPEVAAFTVHDGLALTPPEGK
jgi:hypothetical protein